MIGENYSFISNFLDKKVSIDFCSCFEINHCDFGIGTVKFVVVEYVGNGISAIDEIVNYQHFELGKIFLYLGHILNFSSSLLTIYIYSFYALHSQQVGKKIR